tara:strand:- start:256 stop:543 length:288 start_codon:yes stop_codon:yes gene_type:complete
MGLGNSQVSNWDRFWDWYNRHTTESLLVTGIILFMQIPHMVWAADAILQSGVVWGANPILDFFLYGIDLVEIIPMVNVAMMIYSKIKKGKTRSHA